MRGATASDVPLECSRHEMLLNNFREGKVYQQCCPAVSLACAGCVEYDAAMDSCSSCASGFAPYVAKDGNQTTCKLCSDIPWQDSWGFGCQDYVDGNSCAAGQIKANNRADHLVDAERVHSGMSASEACCACGGGSRQEVPFSYPAVHIPCGKTAVSALPIPRLDVTYVTENCAFHSMNLTMDSRSGRVFGEISTHEPQSISCEIASDSRKWAGTSATLQVHIAHFAYSQSVLTFTELNQSFLPGFQGRYKDFQLRCTPDLPWASIDKATGRISQTSSNPMPRTGECTVSAKGCMDEASGSLAALEDKFLSRCNCTEVTRSTDVVLVAGNEASELFVVREDRRWLRVDEVNLTMGRPTSGFRLASALSAEDSALVDPPLAYHEVFHLAVGGKFAGEPQEGLLQGCRDEARRCQLKLSCKVYGVLPFSKALLMAQFKVTVTDNTCWTPASDPEHFLAKALLANFSSNASSLGGVLLRVAFNVGSR
eukprot:s108_g4.t1